MRIVLSILLSLIIISCNKEDGETLASKDKRYFPLELGSWVEYEVDSITLNDFFDPPLIDTSHSQMRLVVTDSFRDNSNDLVYKVTYYWRKSDTHSWQVNRVYVVSDEGNALHLVENNLRMIKLVYPITETTIWFGNSFFHPSDETEYIGEDTFKYAYIHQNEDINSISFDSIVSVEATQENLIEKNDYIEKYAAGIGLVYRKYVHLEKQNITGDWENGFDIEYRVTDYKQD